MRSIAIMNQKGGVGKTTTSANLSAALAEMGYRVLLIDMDPQAHASLHFGVEPIQDFPSIYDVLVEDKELREVRLKTNENLWLIPAHLDLAAAEFELSSVVGREVILRDKLLADDMTFDYIIIDCPPSLGILSLNALAAVEEVFIPLQPHSLALHGLSKLLNTVELVVKRLNRNLHVTGVVFCLYERTGLAREVIEDMEQFVASRAQDNVPWSKMQIFKTMIRRNVRLAEAPSFGQSILKYAPTSNGAEDYRALAQEVVAQEKDPDKRRPPVQFRNVTQNISAADDENEDDTNPPVKNKINSNPVDESATGLDADEAGEK